MVIGFERGSEFLGYSASRVCENCHQETPHQIREDYEQQSFFFIPTVRARHNIFLFCPVCEKKTKLVFKLLYAGSEKRNELKDLLEGGKSYTKKVISQMSIKEQGRWAKRMNKIGAHSLIIYCAS